MRLELNQPCSDSGNETIKAIRIELESDNAEKISVSIRWPHAVFWLDKNEVGAVIEFLQVAKSKMK